MRTKATISGEPGPDALLGTFGDDRIFGQAGNDVLQGAGGNDRIHGGDGDDQLFGALTFQHDWANSADSLYGGAGNDLIYIPQFSPGFYANGGNGNDRFVANALSAVMHLDGGKGFDRLRLDAVNTTNLSLSVADPTAVLTLANGATLTGIEAIDVYGGSGHDSLTGGAFGDTLWGQSGNDLLTGGGGKDDLLGWDGNDSLFGGSGHDKLQIFADDGADVVDGGSGTDRLEIAFGSALSGIALSIADPSVLQILAGGTSHPDQLQRVWCISPVPCTATCPRHRLHAL